LKTSVLNGKQARNMGGVSDWARGHDKCEIYISVEEILDCAPSVLVIYLFIIFIFISFIYFCFEVGTQAEGVEESIWT
jgi:hypothetical protein